MGTPPAAPPAPPAAPDGGGVEAEIAALGERVGELIEGLNANPDPRVGEQVNELLDAIDHLHREALSRLRGLLAHHDLLGHAVEDPLIAATLDLYELADPAGAPADAGAEPPAAPPPAAVRTPASAPASSPPGLIPLNAAAARPAPAPRLAIGLNDLSVGRDSPPRRPAVAPSSPASTPVAASPRPPAEAPAEAEPPEWTEVGPVSEVAPGTVMAPDEGALLLANVGGEIHAYRNGCGNGPLALHMGRIVDGRRLACPWHIGCIYDLATGVSGEPPDQRRLIRYPVRVRDGTIEVAFNQGAIPAADPAPSAAG